MLNQFLEQRILSELPYEANTEQLELVHKWADFLTTHRQNRCFVLRGYAGTGKTSMVAALVRAMDKLKQRTCLLAPTGRAAKVLSSYSGFPAYTIHKCIYRQRSMVQQTFDLSFNAHAGTLFIVDEASMISNDYTIGSQFGTGCLLDDLIQYVYAAPDCRLLLIGDTAQLPPVGQSNSPALDDHTLSCYGLELTTHELTIVARQQLESGILYNATILRNKLIEGKANGKPYITTDDFDDIRKISGSEMLELIEQSYREAGLDNTIIVNRTNKRMNMYNNGIRNQILWKEDLLSGGDRVMITKNNYYWSEKYEGLSFLANGDMLEVVRMRNERQLYGYKFADASLSSLDYDWEIDVIVWLDTLLSESPDESYKMQRKLFELIAEDYPEIHSKKELVKTIMSNPYYNALQIKHAYAVTCHKAQGGQWKNVFIDEGNLSEDMYDEDYYRWLYTAITRAKEKIYLINFE